ncbi:hypothetical protein MUN74_05815 [Agromyces endophyticus]|uniref:hypothetical protein n=1 Tax=Agromyces sp. H17E-10 TaxID=2932244 RepID=UPI001FD1EF67|nr:hypothetical protein [Agromyces sp. H17E-10]UOQ90433.1 hypothetical protein MUN74_05815 [Agromyces sp. H17E-10]
MKIWVVAVVVTAATLLAVAAAYGVGVVAGVQAGIPGAAPIGREPLRGPVDDADHEGSTLGLHVHDEAVVVGPFDPSGTVEVRCARGEFVLGGGRLGAGDGLRVVEQGPVAGDGSESRPIGWRVEVERTDVDRSPRPLAAYAVCRSG